MQTDETSYQNEVPCPFDGRDLYAEWNEREPCEHLVADWAADVYDNGGGVLGDGIGGRELPANVWELARVCWDVYDAIPRAAEESVDGGKRQLAALQGSFSRTDPPKWWSDLCELIWEKPSEQRPAEDDDEFGELATAIIPDCIDEVETIVATWAVLGGMTSGVSWFLWSTTPEKAKEEIAARIDKVICQLRAVVQTLKDDTGSASLQ